ncbi:hypothetical protein DUI70_3614 [Streptomyces albus]|nr:hypothetical protein DUI70_3614 [Streptomyces albus]
MPYEAEEGQRGRRHRLAAQLLLGEALALHGEGGAVEVEIGAQGLAFAALEWRTGALGGHVPVLPCLRQLALRSRGRERTRSAGRPRTPCRPATSA